jgi:hypothetical protein
VPGAAGQQRGHPDRDQPDRRLPEPAGMSLALRTLHQRILNADSVLDLDSGDTRPFRLPTPAQLPAGVAAFVGRAEHLQRLDTLVAEHDDGQEEAMVIAVVTGAAGVGKSALALHWAHRAASRFPDGQLYVDLRGRFPHPPTRPLDALARLLYALGVPANQIPTDLETAEGLYRSLLADKRLLVVLDNAVIHAQVWPLLPGSAGCFVLVTSRHRLDDLIVRDGAHHLPLDVLTPDETRVLLTRILPPKRLDTETDAMSELTRAPAAGPADGRGTPTRPAVAPHRRTHQPSGQPVTPTISTRAATPSYGTLQNLLPWIGRWRRVASVVTARDRRVWWPRGDWSGRSTGFLAWWVVAKSRTVWSPAACEPALGRVKDS